MIVDLSGRVAVVIGGTSGIGRATVLSYARSGAAVVFQGRDEAKARQLIDECKDCAVQPIFVAADLYDPIEVATVAAKAKEEYGRVDILFASGGTADPKAKLFQDVPVEEIELFFRSRSFHRYYAIHSVLPIMREQGYGKIVSLVTDAARTPTPAEALIGAASASVIFFTRALAKEVARLGIRVNAIATSLTTDTGPYEKYKASKENGSNEVLVRAFAKIEALAPFGLNNAKNISDLALFLSAPESDQISGATVSINGGISFPQY